MIDFGDAFIKNDPVQTLRNFTESQSLSQREIYPRVLECILQTESPELIMSRKDEILDSLDQIASDKMVEVRASLVGNGNMIGICTCLTHLEQSFVQTFGVFLLDRILLIVLKYMSDEPTIRKGANTTLLFLIENGYLDKIVVKRTVCPVIIDLIKLSTAKSDQAAAGGDHDVQLNAIGIMGKVAPIIGTEHTREIFFQHFVQLTSSFSHNIRKHCATVFPVMCEVLGSELLESDMIPIYVRLCDDTIWSIRNTCAQNIPMISILCSLSLRRKYLVPIMKKFMFDESRWVITSALNNLGEFLASFSQPPIIGLAYSYRLDMFITNAADQDFRQQYQSKMLLYSNQPSSSVIIQNLEHYEKEFAKEFLITADASDKKLISIALPTPPISHMAAPNDTKKVNIESYLLNIIKANSFNDRMNTSTGSGRLSSTTASESDECELFSIQSSSLKQEVKEEPQEQKIAKVADLEDPFAKFLKFNTPLKNNFLNNRVLTPTSNESHTFVWNMTMKILNNGSQEKDSGMYTIEDFENVYKEFRNNGPDEDEDLDDCDEEDYITDYNNMGGSSLGGGHAKLGGVSPSVQLYDNLATGESSTDDSGMGYGRRNLSNVTVRKRGADVLNNNDSLDDDLPPPPPPITEESEAFEKILDNLTLRDKLNNNEEDLDQYNSHQYWRIEPTCEIILEPEDRNNNQLPEEFDISSASTVEDTSMFNHDADDGDSTDSMKVNYNKNQVIYNKLQAFNEVTEGVAPAPDVNDNLEVEWNLIEDFVYMKDIDNDLSYKCAYSFPAVLLTLGKKFWPLLQQHFDQLCNDLQCSVRVRKTIAKSIYQIGLIIGAEQTTKDLVEPFIEFFKDVDEIKVEVVKLLSSFIKIVDGSQHEKLIDQLEQCLRPPINMVNWRLREQVGIQIIELSKFSHKIQKDKCILFLTGLALKLMMDKYDCVRKVGIDAFVSCCDKIKQKKQLLKFLSFHFAGSPKWRERQVYILTVEKLILHKAIKVELFNNYVLKKLLELSVEKIPNIRLCVARLLKGPVMETPYFNSDFRESTKHILHQIKNLEMDIDRDVRDCAGNVEPPSPPAVTQDDDREEDQQNDSGGEYASPLVASMSSLCLDSASPNDEVFTEAPEEELN